MVVLEDVVQPAAAGDERERHGCQDLL